MFRFPGPFSIAFLVAVVAAPGLLAQGETCATAEPVGAGTFDGDTTGATSDGASTCGLTTGGPDHWYRYTAPQDGRLFVATCGSSYDTVLAAYSACPGVVASQLACNDDACDLQSRIQLMVRAGDDYLIRVSGYDGASGSYTLAIEFSDQAVTEGCEEVPVIHLDETVEGSTVSAANDGIATCGASGTSPDAFYRFTASKDCLLVARTCRSDFDTVLSIHNSCPLDQGNELACNDDACGLQSTVGLRVSAGSTYWIRVAGFSGATGSYVLELRCEEPPDVDGADLTVSSTSRIRQVGRIGSFVSLSMESTLCNIGSEAIDWRANPDPRHPFLVFNLYRLENGRLEQIGQSWAKHGFAASQTSGICGLSCIPDGSGGLGSGCADIYGVATNADPSTYGPRHEVNPWTGSFTFRGSHIDVNRTENHDALDHRLVVADSDIDPAMHPGAEYFSELYVVAHDDVDHTNSLGWQQVDIAGVAGGTWNLSFRQSVATPGPALEVWEGDTRTIPEGKLTDDGRVVLSAKATDNGDGTYRYEYAIMNLDMARGVHSFSVEVGEGLEVGSVGFHAVRSRDEGFSNDPWESSREGAWLTWSTRPFAQDAASNPLRWGTLYNFWFDAPAEPADSAVRVLPYEPGGPAELLSTSIGPSGGKTVFRRGDADQNRVVELTDAVVILGYLFLGEETPRCLDAADADDSGRIDISDAVGVLFWAFDEGREPAPPGPFECGPDGDPDELALCRYDSAGC